MEEHPFSPIPQQQPAPQQQSPAPPPYTQVSSYAVPSPTPEQPQPTAQVPPPPVYPPNFGQPQPAAPYPPQQPIYPQMQPMQPMPAPKQKKRRTKQKPSPEQARLTKLAWIAIWLAFLLLVYCIASDLFRYFEMDGQTPTLQQSQSSTLNIQYQERPVSDAITQPDENGAYTVAGVAEAVAPSIVEITAASGSMPTSSGSGIILSEDGYIVTNAHVIYDSEYGCGEATAVEIRMSDEETTYDAKVVAYDIETDLAVLKVDQTGLTAAEFGDSDQCQVGDAVVAIGNPLGLELQNTVTCGIISALNRKVTINDKTMTLIQTDTAINNGNSGGPLINSSGQVVGINSAKMSSSVSSSGATIEGIGFAIPMTEAREIVDDLINYGYVTGRPQLGISCQDVSEAVSQAYNLPIGAYVISVTDGGAAAEAGLQVGDVITAINDNKIETTEELNNYKNEYNAGDTVTLTIVRNGQEQKVSVVLQEVQQKKQS